MGNRQRDDPRPGHRPPGTDGPPGHHPPRGRAGARPLRRQPQQQRLPVRLDLAALRALATVDHLPAPLRGLAGVRTRRNAAGAAAPAGNFRDRIADAPDAERRRLVEELVTGQVAEVLGYATAAAVAPGQSFTELGFDSLTAVDLRNRLTTRTGLTLPATLVFDHPTPEALT
ncbi:acyl carrier protein, partial [Micromonospora sp. DH15]|nr:acyl carrier protein [Micromonospora sp. DH15]